MNSTESGFRAARVFKEMETISPLNNGSMIAHYPIDITLKLGN